MTLKPVIIESPYGAKDLAIVSANIAYAKAAVRDSLRRGEAPLCSALLYAATGILDDNDAVERTQGIAAGLAWYAGASCCVVYQDRGISEGMRIGMEAAGAAGVPVEFRTIEGVRA